MPKSLYDFPVGSDVLYVPNHILKDFLNSTDATFNSFCKRREIDIRLLQGFVSSHIDNCTDSVFVQFNDGSPNSKKTPIENLFLQKQKVIEDI